MGHSPLRETHSEVYSAAQRRALLSVAEASVQHGLGTGRALAVDPARFDEPLQAPRASFVTLKKHGGLRGCIGVLQARRALVDDVAANAFAAAFRDPRFDPLAAHEADELSYHISVLSLPAPIAFESEADLLAQLRPGVDGLILEAEGRRGTFLPSVWETLPMREQFWSHLKRKAGLSGEYFSKDMRVLRYTTTSID